MTYVFLGYGFISTESEKNYTRLFKDFLHFHENKPPKLVITDGTLALTNNSDKIFSCNRLRCNWHLWRNLTQRLGGSILKIMKNLN